jgi:cell division protein FtsB
MYTVRREKRTMEVIVVLSIVCLGEVMEVLTKTAALLRHCREPVSSLGQEVQQQQQEQTGLRREVAVVGQKTPAMLVAQVQQET